MEVIKNLFIFITYYSVYLHEYCERFSFSKLDFCQKYKKKFYLKDIGHKEIFSYTKSHTLRIFV